MVLGKKFKDFWNMTPCSFVKYVPKFRRNMLTPTPGHNPGAQWKRLQVKKKSYAVNKITETACHTHLLLSASSFMSRQQYAGQNRDSKEKKKSL